MKVLSRSAGLAEAEAAEANPRGAQGCLLLPPWRWSRFVLLGLIIPPMNALQNRLQAVKLDFYMVKINLYLVKVNVCSSRSAGLAEGETTETRPRGAEEGEVPCNSVMALEPFRIFRPYNARCKKNRCGKRCIFIFLLESQDSRKQKPRKRNYEERKKEKYVPKDASEAKGIPARLQVPCTMNPTAPAP